MYNEYFGLKETPFSIAPDPRYLYMSEKHREALAHLLYGLRSDGGFVLLTGEVGTGKTTVCRCLLEQIPDNCDTAFILNPKLTVEELLSTICDELGIAYPEGNRSNKVFIDLITRTLLESHAKGRKNVLIIDEAQNLSTEVLEQMRLLTNLETNERKLLQIILIGQPELRSKLAQPELRQLAQRIVARYHLGPLDKREVAFYINHRLAVAGIRGRLFPQSTIDLICRLSGGIPRLINLLCDRALLGAFVEGKERVDKAIVKRSAREVLSEPSIAGNGSERPFSRAWGIGIGLFVVLTCGAVFAMVFFNQAPKPVVVEPKVAGITRGELSSVSRKPVPPLELLHEGSNPDQADVSPAAEPAVMEPSPVQLNLPGTRHPLNEVMAFHALFEVWGAAYQPMGEPVCRQAEAQGLRCHVGEGNLDDLRRFNRPAVLKLSNPSEEIFFATITRLDDETVTLILQDEVRKVPIPELASAWTGSYTLLWRVPPDFRGELGMGDRGPAVEWLRLHLAKAGGKEADPGAGDYFDGELSRRVKEFQSTRGLQSDGIVGPRTLIHLMALSDDPPLLVEKKKDP